ncbi:MAG TPA: hypothetical protein VLD58_01880 [Gemmatimonadales bacterium]|nr:hypothetical protein [Gemmatimonadales bacterium]
MPRSTLAGLAALVALVSACRPNTTRPYFPPVTGAPQIEIELGVREATQALADVLRSDTIPVARVEPRDGFLQSAWFRVQTRKATSARRLGPDVVQIRAWVDPSRPGWSRMTVETVYRPLADPSLSPRDLDRQVPPDHPVGKRVEQIITELARLYEPDSTAAGN